MMAQNIRFGDPEFKVKDVEIFAFDATDVAFAKDTGTECPVDIL